jgi:hypothetical protein|tara:strand:- start:141 stop:470 length:330 start_codon:yes stop_codon:yes gene_type:complete
MEMVERYELEQVLHDEKMAQIRAKTEVRQKKIRERERKDKELFGLREHWTGQKATVTDVANDINPPRSKILDLIDSSDRLVGAHALGYMHATYLRISVIALLWLVYVYG